MTLLQACSLNDHPVQVESEQEREWRTEKGCAVKSRPDLMRISEPDGFFFFFFFVFEREVFCSLSSLAVHTFGPIGYSGNRLLEDELSVWRGAYPALCVYVIGSLLHLRPLRVGTLEEPQGSSSELRLLGGSVLFMQTSQRQSWTLQVTVNAPFGEGIRPH